LKNYLEYLKHIRDECEYLVGASEGLFYEKFIDDETLKRAFVRSLEIIGEATKQIPADFKQNYPLVNWKEMAGMRDVLIHSYFGINYNIVWDVVVNYIPPLLDTLPLTAYISVRPACSAVKFTTEPVELLSVPTPDGLVPHANVRFDGSIESLL
jgi:uncharacterized protein with HEPN domain